MIPHPTTHPIIVRINTTRKNTLVAPIPGLKMGMTGLTGVKKHDLITEKVGLAYIVPFASLIETVKYDLNLLVTFKIGHFHLIDNDCASTSGSVLGSTEKFSPRPLIDEFDSRGCRAAVKDQFNP